MKTVAEKLLVKPGSNIWSSDQDRLGLIGQLPDGVRQAGRLGDAEIALVFADDAGSLRAILDRNRTELSGPTIVWVAYPKANRIDLNRDSLWPILAEYGLRPISQVAIDEVWSALRFRPLGENEPPFTGGRAGPAP